MMLIYLYEQRCLKMILLETANECIHTRTGLISSRRHTAQYLSSKCLFDNLHAKQNDNIDEKFYIWQLKAMSSKISQSLANSTTGYVLNGNSSEVCGKIQSKVHIPYILGWDRLEGSTAKGVQARSVLQEEC